jgi:hypothetical protein
LVAQRTGLRSNLWASEWKRGFHLKRLRDVCRECLTETVHLCLHFGHWERWATGFENAHVPYEEISSVRVDIGVWASNRNLMN